MIDIQIFATLVTFLTLLATSVMAISAAIQAARHGFDLFGATVLGIVTAVGGGTLRDLLIGATPVFWIGDITYLATAGPLAFITFLLAQKMDAGGGRRLRLLMYFDAVGLALFSLVGVQVALAHGTSAPMAVVLGCITGVAGGMVRDLLCGLTPLILKEDLYATISIIGSILYLVARIYFSEEISMALAFVMITVTRFWVVYRSAGK
ncbi:MAG: trimeric intracellular cation channel family protein [Fimbriimonadaceae bacterium]|nr:trimeric intracellular cation channel family protein [Alphaproteobacteria bacterium]